MKARPSAWAEVCSQNGCITVTDAEEGLLYCEGCGAAGYRPRSRTAAWGHEWAAVAWMAEAHLSELSSFSRPVKITRFLRARVAELDSINEEIPR